MTPRFCQLLADFFFTRLDKGGVVILEELGLEEEWRYASEQAALEAGKTVYTSHGTHVNFVRNRYSFFRDILEERGVIAPEEYIGIAMTAGTYLNPEVRKVPIS